ncbi:rhomboid family intramembrane serine protease [Flavobacterium sp. Sd200]|uniref:rhomboid family intramembrane serine protease n=1 Tax=Flavobacterium sp. Sd200 TaxID=2692211 RepID=UPI001367BF31|nr:rhomboid family intramembrane serine protease [Flavobacterium sp. Sd200]MXN92989.1 rhomboid family intramembrane serine protease [Flavobacterium sp. Sd200]
MMRITETVKHLIIINVIVFIVVQFSGEGVYSLLSLHYPENTSFKPWQLITHIFMHASIGHLLSNMLGLFFFGPSLEERWGTSKFLFFYISCGLGAALAQIGISYLFFHRSVDALIELGVQKDYIMYTLKQGLVDRRWAEQLTSIDYNNLEGNFFAINLGASGAIYGILVAFAFLFPNVNMYLFLLPIPIKAKYFVTGIIAIDLFSALKGQSLLGSVGGIAHFAHLGGALLGFIMMWYWNKNQFNNNRWN